MENLSNIKIIFSDIDGTLLPFEGKDMGPTAALIEALLQAGIHFVPCTGRGTGNVPREILNVPSLRYLITANGAMIWDLKEDKLLYQRLIHRELGKKLVDYLRRFPGNAYLYRNGQHFLDTAMGQWPPRQGGRSLEEWIRTVVKCDFTELLEEAESENVDKFGFASPHQQVFDQIRATLPEEPYFSELALTSSGPWNVEINAAGAEKGAAALWLTQQLGLAPENMLCAGDNANDITLLRAGALSLAPENALPEVKALATQVVPDCRLDGVENFLKQLLN